MDTTSCAELFRTTTAAEVDLESFRTLCAEDYTAYAQRAHTQNSNPLVPFGELLSATSTGAFHKPLECKRPASFGLRSLYDEELLAAPLAVGRRCRHELCRVDNCGLHVRDSVLVQNEAERLVSHGLTVLDAEDDKPNPALSIYPPRSRRIDFLQSAMHGSIDGHLLALRVAERLRRIAAEAFGIPHARISLAEHFLTVRQPGPSFEKRWLAPHKAVSSNHLIQSCHPITSTNHVIQSPHPITSSSHVIQSPHPIMSSNHLIQSWHPITSSSHVIQSSHPIMTSNHLIQSCHPITSTNHVIQSPHPITSSSHVIQSPHPIMSSNHLIQSWHPITSSSHVIQSPHPIMTSNHLIQSCHPITSSNHGIQSSHPIMASNHLIQSCHPIISSSHVIQSPHPVMSSNHVSPSRSFPAPPQLTLFAVNCSQHSLRRGRLPPWRGHQGQVAVPL